MTCMAIATTVDALELYWNTPNVSHANDISAMGAVFRPVHSFRFHSAIRYASYSQPGFRNCQSMLASSS
jgi:hypothetical protein